MKRHSHLKLFALVVVGAFAGFVVVSWQSNLLKSQDPVQKLSVVVARRGNLFSAVTATGTLEPLRTVDIKYDVEAPVNQLDVKEGDHVTTGEALAVMDTSILDHQLAEARQMVEKDQTTLDETKGQLERAQALWRDQLIARADLDLDHANYEAMVHQTDADAQNVMQIQDQISRATLRSPINGVVIAVYVHQGEMLGSAAAVAALGPADAFSKPTNTLMTVAQRGPLVVDADLNEVDLGGVWVGQPVKFTADAFRPKVFMGRVGRIALQPTVINNVTTYRTIITVLNPDPRFRIGLPVNVMLLKTQARNAVLLPDAAIQHDSQGAWVKVLRPKHAPEADDKAQAPSGIVEGRIEKVVVKVLSETHLAAAIGGPVRSGEWIVLKDDPSNGSPTKYRVRFVHFDRNPTFANFDFSSGSREVSRFVPGPKPGGWLNRLLSP